MDKLQQLGKLSFWTALLLLLLAACQQGNSSLADELPLADNQPTFVFFFTNG